MATGCRVYPSHFGMAIARKKGIPYSVGKFTWHDIFPEQQNALTCNTNTVQLATTRVNVKGYTTKCTNE